MTVSTPLAFIFDSIGWGEGLVLLALVLIVYGPRRLPEMARKLGRLLAQAQRAADLFRLQLMSLDREDDAPEATETPVAATEPAADALPPEDDTP